MNLTFSERQRMQVSAFKKKVKLGLVKTNVGITVTIKMAVVLTM